MYKTAELMVTVPEHFNENAIETFLREKAWWIIKEMNFFANAISLEKINNVEKYENCRFRAKVFVKERLRYYNQFYGYSFKRISIKDHSARWGSCSAKRNLNFNYRIMFLPQKLADYIIVHELCHLKEMNHSKKFWKLVAEVFPNHKILRKELSKIVF